jgi:hypothetical protein
MTGENEVSWDKHVPLQLHLSQTPHDLELNPGIYGHKKATNLRSKGIALKSCMLF